MTQATISRRRPCSNCGGRYFVRTISVLGALLATVIALGGIAKAVVSSGVIGASNTSMPEASNIFAAGAWALGGIVIAGIVAVVAGGHRCIRCDAHQ